MDKTYFHIPNHDIRRKSTKVLTFCYPATVLLTLYIFVWNTTHNKTYNYHDPWVVYTLQNYTTHCVYTQRCHHLCNVILNQTINKLNKVLVKLCQNKSKMKVIDIITSSSKVLNTTYSLYSSEPYIKNKDKSTKCMDILKE